MGITGYATHSDSCRTSEDTLRRCEENSGKQQQRDKLEFELRDIQTQLDQEPTDQRRKAWLRYRKTQLVENLATLDQQ